MDSSLSAAECPPISSVEIEKKIRGFLAHNVLFSESEFPYGDEASFLKEGVIDSLGILDLVTFVSQEFGLEVGVSELTPENFDSVARLAAYIRRKQRAGSASEFTGIEEDD